MTDRFPLIINSEDQQIQELSSGDKLDLTGSGVVADVFTVDTNSEERLRIDISGRIGIGLTNPSVKLHADGSDVEIRASDNASSKNISLYGGSSSNDPAITFTDALRFYSNSGSAERMRIDSNGNIGINQTSVNSLRKMEITQPSGYSGALRIQSELSSGDPGYIEWFNGASQYKIGINHTTDALKFLRNNAELMRIDSSGRLLLGTTTEGQQNADNLTIADSGHCGLTIRSGTTSGGAIYFSDATSGGGEYDGYIEYNHHSRFMRFGAAQDEAMRIDSSGRLLVGRTTSVLDNIGGIGYDNIVQIEGAAIGSGLSVSNTGGTGRINIARKYSPSNGDDLGYLSFGAEVGSTVERARITCAAEFTNANTRGGRLVFATCADGAHDPMERMRIDSSGRMLLDTTTAEAAHADADDFIIGRTNKSESGMTIVTSTGGNGTINFSDGASSQAQGQIQYYQGSDYMSFDTGAEERMRMSAAGIQFGKTTGSTSSGTGLILYPLVAPYFAANKSASGNHNGIIFYSGSTYVGGLNYSNSATTLVASSDYRLKENIVSLPDAITRAKQLNPIQFNFIAEPDETTEGFLAHEVGEVVPLACFGEKDAVDEDGNIKPQALSQVSLIPLLTAALQEAIAKIETLEAKVAALEAN
jgi:hypothetical protein